MRAVAWAACLLACVAALAATGNVQWTDTAIVATDPCTVSGIWASRTGANKGAFYSCEGSPTKTWVLVNDTGSGGGGNPTPYEAAFTNATTVSISGATHNRSGRFLACYDASNPNAAIEPDTYRVDPSTLDVTITFFAPQSGRCLIE